MRVGIVMLAAVATAACRGKSEPVEQRPPETPPIDSGAPPRPGEPPAIDGGPGETKSEPPAVTVTTESLVVGTLTRSFVLAVPATFAPDKRLPLVLALHGDGGDGAAMRAAYPLDGVTQREAVVAYPSGNGKSWDLYAAPSDNDDLAFIEALVRSLEVRFPLDPARVFASGFSSGGFMVNQIACRRPGLLRAISAHGGGAPAEPIDPEATKWPNGFTQCVGQTTGVAAMIVHGKDDRIVVVGSGEHMATYWAYVNKCGVTRVATTTPECMAYEACPIDKPVVLCTVPGLGHSFWGRAVENDWSFFRGM
ncbi:MAG: hypothetical protein KF819_09640 [Labilithrix sp.]|nr:hypothetical protein [Labilithrix sp.]